MNVMSHQHPENLSPGTVYFPEGPCFTAPQAVCEVHTLSEVADAMAWARTQHHAGRYVAGFIAYEAAPAFEPAFAAHPPVAGLPLVWLGAFDAPSAHPPLPVAAELPGDWQPGVSPEAYACALAEIRARIAAGETYQVNYTFPLRAAAPAAPWAVFGALYHEQPVPHACYLNTGRWQVLSWSPEEFFTLRQGVLHTRPMKGTRARGPHAAADHDAAARLARSEKDRAENVMITDMLRNDMGRVCATGSVRVQELFAVERYATVWQMTSSIVGECQAGVPEVLQALFPSGSVTGAPKVQTSRIIHQVEAGPRGVYCGALGWWSPDGDATFSVGIRTMTIDREAGTAVYPVGSGVTWDSAAASEYRECLDKAALVLAPQPDYALFETLRWEDGQFPLLEGHLARLSASAAYLGFPYERRAAIDALQEAVARVRGLHRVRLSLARTGTHQAEATPFDHGPRRVWRVAIAATRVRRDDRFLHHKTTHRAVYDAARAARPDVDDVLLVNEDGELTESTIANLGVQIRGRCYTPPQSSGLLPGVQRAAWIREGRLREVTLYPADLERAERIFLFNALRGEIEIRVVS